MLLLRQMSYAAHLSILEFMPLAQWLLKPIHSTVP